MVFLEVEVAERLAISVGHDCGKCLEGSSLTSKIFQIPPIFLRIYNHRPVFSTESIMARKLLVAAAARSRPCRFLGAEHVQGHRRAVDRKLHESFAVDCRPGLLHEKLAGIEATRLYVTSE